MRVALLFVLIACLANASDIGVIKGSVTENGIPVKAKIHILRDGYSGIPQGSERIAVAVATPRFWFGAAMTFPVDGPGVYTVVTNRKGTFTHAGLPVGTYSLAVEVSGKLVEQATGVSVAANHTTPIEFKLLSQ